MASHAFSPVCPSPPLLPCPRSLPVPASISLSARPTTCLAPQNLMLFCQLCPVPLHLLIFFCFPLCGCLSLFFISSLCSVPCRFLNFLSIFLLSISLSLFFISCVSCTLLLLEFRYYGSFYPSPCPCFFNMHVFLGPDHRLNFLSMLSSVHLPVPMF